MTSLIYNAQYNNNQYCVHLLGMYCANSEAKIGTRSQWDENRTNESMLNKKQLKQGKVMAFNKKYHS